jgi:hypothetical protein
MAVTIVRQWLPLLIRQRQGQCFRHSIPPQREVKVNARALPDLIIKDHQADYMQEGIFRILSAYCRSDLPYSSGSKPLEKK